MSDADTLTVDLFAEAARLVLSEVASGHYASPREVLDAALQTWSEQRDLLGFSPEEVCRLWNEGARAAPVGEMSLDELHA